MLKEEQDISWNLIPFLHWVNSVSLCQSATRSWALFLAAAILHCVMWLIWVWDVVLGSWACQMPSLSAFASHRASYTGRSPAKGFVLPCSPPSSIHLCRAYAGERLPPPPSFSGSKVSQRSSSCLWGASNLPPPPPGWEQGPDFHLNSSLSAEASPPPLRANKEPTVPGHGMFSQPWRPRCPQCGFSAPPLKPGAPGWWGTDSRPWATCHSF